MFINDSDGTTFNQEGVDIQAPLFGKTDSVEWLDPFHPIGSKIVVVRCMINDFILELIAFVQHKSILHTLSPLLIDLKRCLTSITLP